MKNNILLKDENGNDINVEILLSFSIEEYNKNYIAYTLNDDDKASSVAVFISEVDYENKKILSIPANQKEAVLEVYNNAKQMLLEEE